MGGHKKVWDIDGADTIRPCASRRVSSLLDVCLIVPQHSPCRAGVAFCTAFVGADTIRPPIAIAAAVYDFALHFCMAFVGTTGAAAPTKAAQKSE